MTTSAHMLSLSVFSLGCSQTRRRFVPAALLLLLFAMAGPPLAAQPGDAEAGAALLQERGCIVCHSIGGKGGNVGPDLARRSPGRFTPASLTAMIWNHGPAMWAAMNERNMAVAELQAGEMFDIYAYFFSLRYFEPLGEAGRGKAVFVAKNCNRCHALVETNGGGPGPPVTRWPALTDPVLWIQNMWNHGATMAAEIEREGVEWPIFTVQQMTDLMVFVQNVPGLPSQSPRIRFGQPTAGEDVFSERHCLDCHTLGGSLAVRVNLTSVSREQRSLTGLAVAMWNHFPLMAAAAESQGLTMRPFQGEMMRDLVTFLFEENYFDEAGDAGRGQKLFESKGCGSCHGQAGAGAPELRGTASFTPSMLASAVWNHGPGMLKTMEARGVSWPTLTDRQVMDLIAHLSTPQ